MGDRSSLLVRLRQFDLLNDGQKFAALVEAQDALVSAENTLRAVLRHEDSTQRIHDIVDEELQKLDT